MNHWNYRGRHAAGYSRAVEAASAAVYAARDQLTATLQREYPKGAQVRVTHHRGSFSGAVVGWDPDGTRASVRNNATGKVCKWWAVHVELISNQAQEGT